MHTAQTLWQAILKFKHYLIPSYSILVILFHSTAQTKWQATVSSDTDYRYHESI